MHIADLLMYFILGAILWCSFPEDYRFELGMLMGYGVMIVYTLLYIVLFVFIDYNWIDIYHWVVSSHKFEINW